MVAVVPLTIVGGLFTILSHLPFASWDALVAPHRELLEVPVAATFGLLAVVASLSIAYDLGKRLGQEAIVSASMTLVVFLLLQIDRATMSLQMSGLGSQGLFTAIIAALIVVRVQKLFADWNVVIRMPASVPPVVYQSFLSLTPLTFLILLFWTIRFVLGIDIDALIRGAFTPLVFALNTLPGILVYACLVTMLWSVGINGDNAVDAIVAPIFLQYLAANVAALNAGQPLPYVTANGFFTTFVNVGGTGATIALALILWRSKEPSFRQIGRLSLPTQVFQINEPIFFGLPIVLNPVFMVPYVLNALMLTTGTLSADALADHPQAVRERAVDHAADHRALPGDGRRLEGGGVGRGVDRDRDDGVLPVRQGRRAAAAADESRHGQHEQEPRQQCLDERV